LNVADAEAEPVIGPLKIEMLPLASPSATSPAESTAKAETKAKRPTRRTVQKSFAINKASGTGIVMLKHESILADDYQELQQAGAPRSGAG
jgi:hypothetical protein